MGAAQLARRLWPRSIGSQCLLGLVFGIAVVLALPGAVPLLRPVGQIFLRASQVVVMPYLTVEVIGALGGLSDRSLRQLGRFGGLVLLSLIALGSLLVFWLPGLLPPLVSSAFFSPELLRRPPEPDLIATYLPFNIFTALATDNFPAVVLFAGVLGVVLQGLPEKEVLLVPLRQLRLLFRRLNSLVIRLAPAGVLALTATTLQSMSSDQILRSQGLLLINMIALVVLALVFLVVMLSFTPFSLQTTWQIVRGPLALAASSGNLLIALPMLSDSLTRAFQPLLPQDDEASGTTVADEIAALLPLGFALPTLGQVVSLVFVPFAAWYDDRPMNAVGIAHMLATGIPTVTGGLKTAVRQELLGASLPVDLVALVDLNGNWLYRQEKVLSLLGLVLLVVLVVSQSLGQLRFRLPRLLPGMLLVLAVANGLGVGSRALLSGVLAGNYRNDRILMAMEPTRTPTPFRIVPASQLRPAPVTLEAIRRRGLLRVGVRRDAMPWAYRNAKGQLVGYDIELASALARTLRLPLVISVAPLGTLDTLLSEGRIDLAVGGIQNTPSRASTNFSSDGYQAVHLALVVHDSKLAAFQLPAPAAATQPSFTIAVADPDLLTSSVEEQIATLLGSPARPAQVRFSALSNRGDFFTDAGERRFDALLTTAEGGAAWALLHPRTTMVPSFGQTLAGEVVILLAGDDRSLKDYINAWLSRRRARGFTQRLYRHWILMEQRRPDADASPVSQPAP
ncbi:MAG: cation:dicarboxylase symporter family transporter [Synechococcaceae cyanobacterium]|nr:cation:dicarboxylase symporter family transporter [Synechococcaceae cyanobacterium]